MFWCTADIGWITGHSYAVYGALVNGATTVIFEGIPTYPNPDRFWQTIEKHKITHFYTAPTAIRSLEKESAEWVEKHDLSSLRVLEQWESLLTMRLGAGIMTMLVKKDAR